MESENGKRMPGISCNFSEKAKVQRQRGVLSVWPRLRGYIL